MEWLNYHHLLYFWTVARAGSIARACEELRLAQPTISGQIRTLEGHLGEKLFVKSGRGLALTEVGRVVYQYADEIFSLGRELTDVLKGRPRGRPARLHVGVSDAVPKLIAYRMLAPALRIGEPVRLTCDEDKPERLIAALSSHALDLVLSDAPLTAAIRVKAYNHLLGSCSVSVFGAPALASKYRRRFPGSLDGAPFLLPTETSTLRRSVEQWFDSQRVRPALVAEFQDSALLKTFGTAGEGLFLAPSAIEREVEAYYRVKMVGRIDSIVERYYAISVERRLKHPAVVAISESARTTLFKDDGSAPGSPTA
jgi:LysR family transcriptional regulator, transcriptional activator of nhaA